MARTKGGSSEKTTRRISLSAAAEELATELLVLRSVTLSNSAKLAAHSVERLISVVNACSELMRQHGDLFAAASAVSDVTEIAGQSHGSPRRYDSAHRAAVGEAGHLLLRLWKHLDPAGQSESMEQFLAAAGIATGADSTDKTAPNTSAPAAANKAGMNPRLVVEQWSEAKTELLLRLSAPWERDFRIIPDRIKRERKQLKRSKQHKEETQAET